MRALGAALVAAALVVATAVPAQAHGTHGERCTPVAAGTPLGEAIAGLPDAEASGALLLLHDAGGCRQGAAGIADVRTGRTVPVDGRFRIGSMTKTFTAVVTLQLVAEGRLDLDGTVQHYLPDLLPAGTAPVTVRQVLTYTSGINHVEVPNKQSAWFLEHRYDRWAEGSQIDTAKPLAFTPGTKQRYGNVDYIVAGLLIEKVTGRTWESQIQRRIVEPLGLRGTTAPGRDVEVRGPHAHGYEATAAGWVDVTRADTSLQWSAASIVSTAPDLDRFMVALFSGRLVPEPQLSEMFTVPAGIKLYDGNDDPSDDKDAVYSAGLTKLPVGPLTLWGKSGDRPGYNNGMAATRDLSSRLVFSVNTLHMGGSDQPVRSQRIIAAALLGL
ncbi:serine hydrolase domain-containing protein [Dactylosporangium sp. NPDC050588]|uniref:serine hydrolase domain-containing protein n=1 Tax=Dactylosporangium sp. NPDC050588 TaxID=3157211 RepID=UPI0033EC3E9A